MTKRYPFKFLDAYDRTDTDIFFGRDEEIEALYQMTFQSDILLVYGASGTGKTSLINCGLASRFQAHDWLALNIRRGNDLNAALQHKLEEATARTPAETAADLDLSWLDEEEAADATESPLSRQLTAIYRQYFRPVYLIFDQFEELYILGSKAEQAEFIRNVQEIQAVDQPVKMIFVIREEYLGHLFEFERAVPQLLRKKLRVEPMNLDKVGQVIRGAAALPGSNVGLAAGQEDAIVEGIFQKIRGSEQTLAIQLPYLQVFLDKFYLHVTGDEDRQADAVFTTAALAELGDIGDVLRDFLEEQAVRIQADLSRRYPDLPDDAVWQILSPLATLEGTKEPLLETTLIQRLPHLPAAAVSAGLRQLEQRRILRYDENEGRYEVAHDSLAARIAEHRSDDEIALLEIRRLISSQMALKAEARALFTAKQLNLIDPYLDKLGLEPEARQLIEESRREVVAKARRRRRRNLIVGSVLTAAAIVAVFFAVQANAKTIQANQALADAEVARNKAERSDSLAQIDKAKAIASDSSAQLDRQKALAAQEKSDSLADEAQQALNRLSTATASIVLDVLADAEVDIYHLRQRQALAKYNNAVRTGLNPEAEALWEKGMLELAFFFNEIARNNSARRDTAYTIARQLARHMSAQTPLGKDRVSITQVLKQVDPIWYDSLTRRYYPRLIEVAGNDEIADFKMGQTEVTMWQYQLYCEATQADTMARIRAAVGWGLDGDNPAVMLNWYDAARYANWMSKRADLDTVYQFIDQIDENDWEVQIKESNGFRLPKETEWEYAARGGQNPQDFEYSGSDKIDAVAWYDGNSGGRSRPVAKKKPTSSDLELYDMSGNVWEWCEDWYSEGSDRVIRGGSWSSSADYCRVAYRSDYTPEDRLNYLGFRLVSALQFNGQ